MQLRSAARCPGSLPDRTHHRVCQCTFHCHTPRKRGLPQPLTPRPIATAFSVIVANLGLDSARWYCSWDISTQNWALLLLHQKPILPAYFAELAACTNLNTSSRSLAREQRLSVRRFRLCSLHNRCLGPLLAAAAVKVEQPRDQHMQPHCALACRAWGHVCKIIKSIHVSYGMPTAKVGAAPGPTPYETSGRSMPRLLANTSKPKPLICHLDQCLPLM